MFKSPIRNVPTKKSPINFIKTVASPRQQNRQTQIQTSKIISMQSDFVYDKYGHQSSKNLLSIDLNLERPETSLKLAFYFTSETTIQELTNYIKKEIGYNYLYFKTKNINFDYMLTLTNRKVIELGVKKLDIQAGRLKIDKKGYFLNSLEIIKCVGTGGFSRVYLCRGYGKLMALKVINKSFIIQNQKKNIIQNQREILEKCNGHPFITQLYLSFQTKNYLIFCMEYCNGGELFNLLRKVKRMKQQEAKFYFLETLAAISHLHSQKILYRDLKPQNIIIDSQGHIRLADYGLSKIMKEDMTHSFCGSAQYMAPEMLLKKGHSFEIDYYCLGALLYELLFGLPPYYSRNQNELFHNIVNKQLEFPPNFQLSKDLKKFFQRLLEKNTDFRFKTVKDILAHPWLRNCNMQDVLAKKLTPPFKTQMFENNFDDSDFAQEEQTEMLKLERQKDRGKLSPQEAHFPNFTFVENSFLQLQRQIELSEGKKLDFYKKPSQIAPQSYHVQNQVMWRNGSMRSIDNSQYFQNSKQNSPRVVQQNFNRSTDKFKVFVPYSSHQQTTYGSQMPYVSPKTSQIINLSRESVNESSKLMGVRSVPIIEKSQVYQKGNERMGSPININNYINIYTSKSPPSHQAHLNANHFISPQPKKTFSYGNSSFQKSINNSTLKNGTPNGSINGSMQRMKFSSLQKPLVSNISNGSSVAYLKNNVYYQNNSNALNRGYLFKDRVNPAQKIKKTFKANQKFSFNLLNTASPYKH